MSTEIQRISYTHEAMIDYIIAHPTADLRELSLVFDRSPSWISTIKCSDIFRERMIERTQEIVDPQLSATIRERFDALATRSLEVLQEKLTQPVEMVSDELALKAAELGAKGLAVGGFAPKGSAPQVVVNNNRIELLAERLTQLIPSRAPAAEVVDLPSTPLGDAA